jgi:putative transposase
MRSSALARPRYRRRSGQPAADDGARRWPAIGTAGGSLAPAHSDGRRSPFRGPGSSAQAARPPNGREGGAYQRRAPRLPMRSSPPPISPQPTPVRRALAALFGSAVGKDQPRLAQGEGRLGCLDSLKDEPIIRLILDGTAVRVRLDKKNLDLFAQGTGPWPDRLYEELFADYRIGKTQS